METPFLWTLSKIIKLDIHVLKDYFYLVCGSDGLGPEFKKISQKESWQFSKEKNLTFIGTESDGPLRKISLKINFH